MIKSIIAYILGRRTPQQMLKQSEKALGAIRKITSTLEKNNAKIEEEKKMSDALIQTLEEQAKIAKLAKAAYVSVQKKNNSRIKKVNDWLNDIEDDN